MPSYHQLVYHIVIRTKYSRKTILLDHADNLYAYISGIIKNKNSHLYRINGIEDHLHILTDIHPSIALADFVKDIKVSSSLWLKKSGLFPDFEGWSDRYGAFTCSYPDSGRLINYIKNQHKHHKVRTFEEEYRNLLVEAGIEIDPQYFP